MKSIFLILTLLAFNTNQLNAKNMVDFSKAKKNLSEDARFQFLIKEKIKNLDKIKNCANKELLLRIKNNKISKLDQLEILNILGFNTIQDFNLYQIKLEKYRIELTNSYYTIFSDKNKLKQEISNYFNNGNTIKVEKNNPMSCQMGAYALMVGCSAAYAFYNDPDLDEDIQFGIWLACMSYSLFLLDSCP
ncbi:MAG: hypothetical protein KGZ59_05860 [Chitinophagaceae bacterium]|nr:hypothetical protein [Chitinophagaceae bacterium]